MLLYTVYIGLWHIVFMCVKIILQIQCRSMLIRRWFKVMISFFQVFIQSKVNERETKRQPQQQRSEETNQGAADFSEV